MATKKRSVPASRPSLTNTTTHATLHFKKRLVHLPVTAPRLRVEHRARCFVCSLCRSQHPTHAQPPSSPSITQHYWSRSTLRLLGSKNRWASSAALTTLISKTRYSNCARPSSDNDITTRLVVPQSPISISGSQLKTHLLSRCQTYTSGQVATCIENNTVPSLLRASRLT